MFPDDNKFTCFLIAIAGETSCRFYNKIRPEMLQVPIEEPMILAGHMAQSVMCEIC